MLKMLKDISMVPKGLKYKTMIGFALMSLIPIMVFAWIVVTYIFPNIDLFFGLSMANISFILAISILISILGLYITKEMIDPVIKMAGDARIIANGDVTKFIDVNREDEVGDLSRSLNIMTEKIKENMEELKAYGEKTKQINLEINKKVLALSGLLQIGNLISSSKELNNTLDFIIQKVSDIEDNSTSFLLLPDSGDSEYIVVSGYNLKKDMLDIKIKQQDLSASLLMKKFELKNIESIPVTFSGKLCGMLVVGNNDKDFIFADDEKELLKVFAKQISIAVENDMLVKKSKELAIKDEVTCLYNYNYLKSRLDEEIKRAIVYQRPCGYLLIDVDNFKEFSIANGAVKAETLLKEIGSILKNSVMEIDKAGRLCDDKFGVILPEKNKRQSAHVAEEIRKKIEDEINKIIKVDKKVTVSIGVSENPIDGITAEELMEKAERLARNAKSLGKNRVAV